MILHIKMKTKISWWLHIIKLYKECKYTENNNNRIE